MNETVPVVIIVCFVSEVLQDFLLRSLERAGWVDYAIHSRYVINEYNIEAVENPLAGTFDKEGA